MGCEKEDGGRGYVGGVKSQAQSGSPQTHPQKNVASGVNHSQQTSIELARTIGGHLSRAPNVLNIIFSPRLHCKFPIDKTFSRITDISQTLQMRTMN